MNRLTKVIVFFCIGILSQVYGNKFDEENNKKERTILNVYFGTSGDETKGIYHAKFDIENGKLSKAQLVAEIGSPGFLALHPNNKIIYAVGQLEGQSVVAGYQIDSNSNLSLYTESFIKDGSGTHISVHPSGRFLLTAQYGAGSIELFPIKLDGSLGNSILIKHKGGSNIVPGRQDQPHPHWCGFSPDGQYAFVPDLGMDKIIIYQVNKNEPAINYHGFAESIPGGGPRHMRFSVDGKFIYLLNELSLSVTTFLYDSLTGTAVRQTTTPTLSEEVKAKEISNSAAEILVHPNGRFVYSSNRGHDSITSYEADSENGKLTVIEVEPIRGSWPRNINMDPSGRWLLSAGAHSNTISVHEINQLTGELTFQQNSIINVPGSICILFAE
jgi:6-phosphogluconolactonase